MQEREKWMQRCIELAENGLGHVAPNPLVGAVLVHDGKIAGEGFHQQFGAAHAEVNAIHDAVSKNGEGILRESTLYVNLEPCTHFGKTPPCTDLIIQKKIPKVVIGCMDPNPAVNGTGIQKLTEAGVEVIHHVLEKSCRRLNRRFLTFHEKQRPYIILKYAQSIDGYIAPLKITPEDKWISNEYSRMLVHKWRSEEQAIMVGMNTVKIDNPMLTTRDWRGKNPVRILLDRELKLDVLLNVYDSSASTLIYNGMKNETDNNIEFVRIDLHEKVLPQIMHSLHNKNIQSVMVEGGAKLLQQFIDENLWDEARIFTGSTFLGNGTKSPAIEGNIVSEETILNNKLVVLKNG